MKIGPGDREQSLRDFVVEFIKARCAEFLGERAKLANIPSPGMPDLQTPQQSDDTVTMSKVTLHATILRLSWAIAETHLRLADAGLESGHNEREGTAILYGLVGSRRLCANIE